MVYSGHKTIYSFPTSLLSHPSTPSSTASKTVLSTCSCLLIPMPSSYAKPLSTFPETTSTASLLFPLDPWNSPFFTWEPYLKIRQLLPPAYSSPVSSDFHGIKLKLHLLSTAQTSFYDSLPFTLKTSFCSLLCKSILACCPHCLHHCFWGPSHSGSSRQSSSTPMPFPDHHVLESSCLRLGCSLHSLFPVPPETALFIWLLCAPTLPLTGM